MTAPTDPSSTSTSSAPRLRAGQPVIYRFPDPITGTVLTGPGMVVRAGAEGENVAVLPLSPYHLEVAAEDVQPAKVADVLPAALADPAADPAPATA